MKLYFKTLGGGGSFELEISENSSVTELRSLISQQLQASPSNFKIVYKGRTLVDGNNLSHYKLFDGAKVHVSVSKSTKTEGLENVQKKTKPKYDVTEFWVKLDEVLSKQYDSSTVATIVHQFRMDYDRMLKTMSLDDIERIAKRNLSR